MVSSPSRRGGRQRGRGGAWAAPHRADPRDQLPRGERLGQVVVGADPQADELVDLLGAGGQHDDVGVAEGADAPARLDAVHPGQHEVQHDHLRLEGLGQRDRLLAVAGRGDLEAFAFQVAGDQPYQRRLVVDHQRPHGRRPAHLVSAAGHRSLTRWWWRACGPPAAPRSRA
jgi:hypothetical protein